MHTAEIIQARIQRARDENMGMDVHEDLMNTLESVKKLSEVARHLALNEGFRHFYTHARNQPPYDPTLANMSIDEKTTLARDLATEAVNIYFVTYCSTEDKITLPYDMLALYQKHLVKTD